MVAHAALLNKISKLLNTSANTREASALMKNPKRRKVRMYDLVAVNNKTGKETLLTKYSDTHAHVVTMMGKFSYHPARRIEIREVAINPKPRKSPAKKAAATKRAKAAYFPNPAAVARAHKAHDGAVMNFVVQIKTSEASEKWHDHAHFAKQADGEHYARHFHKIGTHPSGTIVRLIKR